MRRLFFCSLLAISCLASVSSRAAHNEDSLVHVMVTYQEPDPGLPWRKRAPGVRYGYGVLVKGDHILTTEGLIRNSTLIELQRPRSGSKITAVVETMDPEVNLAILTPTDKTAISAMKPAVIARSVPTTAEVTALQIDETKEVQTIKGEIKNLSVRALPAAPYASACLKMQTESTPPGHGAPVFYKKRLAGIVMSQYGDRNVSYLLPPSAMRRFLEDAANPPYRGVASAGFTWRPLVDPVHREYLNVKEPGKGILVLSCLIGTGAMDVLKPNDVVLKWNDSDVDNLGYYEDKEFGRLPFSYMIKARSSPGDKAAVLIVRDKKEMTVQLPLTRWSNSLALIPENESNMPSEYLVTGGLLIRELSADYLRAHGKRWKDYMDSYIVHLYIQGPDKPPKEGDHVVILSGVLPDPINVGYQHFRDRIITHVNGKPIRNMDDVFRIKAKDGVIYGITLHSIDVDLVLDRKKISDADKRIAQTYRIPALSYRRPRKRDTGPATAKNTPHKKGD